MSAKQTILNKLAEDDLGSVFQGFLSLADKYKDDQLRTNATFQSGRLKALEKQKMDGSISQEEDYLQTAKIRKALLQIARDIPDDWTLDGMKTSQTSTPASMKMNWKKYAAAFAAVITVLAGIAELSGYSVRDAFQQKENTEMPEKTQPPSQKASTTGNNSPAVITDDGDVNINFGEPKPQNDSASTSNTPK